MRHPTTASWSFPPAARARPPDGVERTNLRELVARPDRFEHHAVTVARLGAARLEVATASEPACFSRLAVSDEFAAALPTGDVMVDLCPLRTYVIDPVTGADIARYHHKAGDLVLHPVDVAHWPGRLRAPYAPIEVAAGSRRRGISLVYRATEPTPSTAVPLALDPRRASDVKAYVSPAPTLSLASLAGDPGVVGTIGDTELALVASPHAIAPPRGGWVVILEGSDPHAPLDLLRLSPGTRLPGTGIERALVLSSVMHVPEPASWDAIPRSPFAPFEDASPGELPISIDRLAITERSPSHVRVAVDELVADVPRYWLARTLFRVALHGLRLGRIETYEGLFVDDSELDLQLGLRTPAGSAVVAVARDAALATVERLYRAVAPPDYVERIT